MYWFNIFAKHYLHIKNIEIYQFPIKIGNFVNLIEKCILDKYFLKQKIYQLKLKIYLTIISCILVISAFTQSNNVESKNHDEYDHEHKNHHDHHRNEIGVANAPVYFINEKQFAYGLHVHYIRSIPNSKFGIGLGYERIFDAHKAQYHRHRRCYKAYW